MRAFPQAGDEFGDYVVERELGRGAMGIVYLAQQQNLSRPVALKLLSPALDQPEFRKRFEREARLLARLHSAYVVSIHEYGEHDGWLYLTNPYLPAGDLQARIEAGPIEPAEALRLFGQLASGLAAAHQLGIVHRDIKPSNVLLAEEADGLRPLLADFGIARDQGIDSTLTGGAVIGTLPYMPPERHLGGHATSAGDVYALGCVLWAMLHQRAPFVDGNGMLLLRALLDGPPPVYAGPLAHQINPIVERCLATDPENRFADATELRMALLHPPTPPPAQPAPPAPPAPERKPAEPTVRAPGTGSGGIPPVPPPEPAPPRSRRKLVAGLALLVVLCVAAVVVIIAVGQDADPGSGETPTTDVAMHNAPPVGSCYNLRGDQLETARTPVSQEVSCSDPHTSLTVGVVEVPPEATGEQHEVTCFEEALRFLGAEPGLFIQSLLNLSPYLPVLADVDAGASWIRCDVHMGFATAESLPEQVTRDGLESGVLDPSIDWCRLEDGGGVPCSDPHEFEVVAVPEVEAARSYPVNSETQTRLAVELCPTSWEWSYTASQPVWEAGYRYLVCWA
ncbi:MAG TPA: protein kinase [Nocardioides sp.]|nr:protein kinase [Nocardioides sp.]